MTTVRGAEAPPPQASAPNELVSIRQAWGAILFAGLGYFVDIFDLLLFAVVRVASVRDLGAGDRTIEVGTLLQNAQLIGLMAGGLVWGVLGDRRGRRSALYGSILLYSLANIANAFVSSVPQYAAWRFVAGFGLAGELGAALTLVSEMVDRRQRGTATTLVATIGVLGAVAAAIVGELVPWRTAYLIGGGLGLALLVLRLRLQGFGDVCPHARPRRAARQCLAAGQHSRPRLSLREIDPDRRARVVLGRDPAHVLAGAGEGSRRGG